MKIFNTLSGRLEEFKSINEGVVNMYVCGPTVYNYAHIGNMLPPIVFDMVYRYFTYLGYKVNYASNFTDVDDKIINAALELNVEEKEITEKFIKIYLNNMDELNCFPLYKRPKVTESMDSIIKFIQLLLDKGYAYKSGTDVYFDTTQIKDYGILSKQNMDSLNNGARIIVSENKRSSNDFVLWKETDKGIKWDAPFGTGRPGWHTECVVMINDLFGHNIDIHGGGVDLKFPHHENERAQNIAAYNSELANYWMHNGHVMVNGVKMSKSLGNFILAKDVLEKYNSNVIRLAIFKSHYRTPIDFKDELFSEAKSIDEKLNNVFKQASLLIKFNGYKYGVLTKDEKINEIMDNDFNTPNLLTYQNELLKKINVELRSKTDFIDTLDRLILINNILGLDYKIRDYSDEEMNLYNEWNKARGEKSFELADELRKKLEEANIL